jgi:hypothetical protein
MGGLVIVYCFVIADFHFVSIVASLFSPVGPLWSWLGEEVVKLYSTSFLGLLGISPWCPIGTSSS